MAYHVATADEFASALLLARTQWPRANHYVWAYIFRQGEERMTDDGEPQTTAGAPTLNLLKMRQLVHSAVITIRYFGGTKLGTGGLVRAYHQAGEQALVHARVGMEQTGLTVQIRLPYNEWGALQRFLAEHNIPVTEEYSECVTAQFRLPMETWTRIKDLLLYEVSPHSQLCSTLPTNYIEPCPAQF
jgi:putative IMPACT (imprinted ancient) family translation regulator